MLKTKMLVILLCCVQILSAQFDHEPVSSELSGILLWQQLVEDYKPSTVLTLTKARDTLFAKVWSKNDTLKCVYTDYARYMDPNEDPTQTVFNDGAANGINTEHSWPRSKGAGSGNPEADMHHLFPTRVDINGVRASHPFNEIPDIQTSAWYYKDEKLDDIPPTGIDNYSEFRSGLFEVREAFAGNVARAAFYFYTMYRDEANTADPGFFENQRNDLCNWHFQDPVDEQEWNATHTIANYQDGLVNPFVLDCSLATRMYCDDISDACALVHVNDIDVSDFISISPNPVQDFLKINVAQDLVIKDLSLVNLNGLSISQLDISEDYHKVSHLSPGFYLLKAETNRGVLVLKVVKH